jgi:replication-associated recombination protein RarA
MKRKNKNSKLEAEKIEIESKIAEIDAENSVVKKTIPKVKKRDRLSTVLFGPEKCGKSTIAYFLAEEQQRGVVNLNELYSW